MNKAILRNVRLGLRLSLLQAAFIVPISAVLRLWFSFLSMPMSLGGTGISMLVVVMIFFEMAWFMTYFKWIIGSGVTRDNFNTASLVLKAIWAVVIGAIVTVAVAASLSPHALSFRMFVGATLCMFALECLGDFWGTLVIRYGKIGFFIYIVSFTTIVFSLTMTIGLSIARLSSISVGAIIEGLNYPVIYIVAILFSLVLLYVNWKIIKAVEIKS